MLLSGSLPGCFLLAEPPFSSDVGISGGVGSISYLFKIMAARPTNRREPTESGANNATFKAHVGLTFFTSDALISTTDITNGTRQTLTMNIPPVPSKTSGARRANVRQRAEAPADVMRDQRKNNSPLARPLMSLSASKKAATDIVIEIKVNVRLADSKRGPIVTSKKGHASVCSTHAILALLPISSLGVTSSKHLAQTCNSS